MKRLLSLLLVGVLSVVAVAAKISIPASVLQQKFGEGHSFNLTVHGPNPVFTQAGYKFQVKTYGFLLSNDIYYKVPVYIDLAKTGKYELVSTAEYNYSVDLELLGGPNGSKER